MGKGKAPGKEGQRTGPSTGTKREASGTAKGPAFGRPVAGILLGGAALVQLLGLVSYRPKLAAGNLAGPVGHSLAATLLDTLGLGAYAAAGFLLVCAVALLAGRPRLNPLRIFAWAAACGGAMALAALLVQVKLQGHLAGGLVGALAAAWLRSALSTTGAAVLLSALFAAALVVATDLWALRAAAAAGRLSFAGGALAFKGAALAVDAARRRASGGDDDSFGDEEHDGEHDGGGGEADERDGAAPAGPDSGGPDSAVPVPLTGNACALARASADEPPKDPRLPTGPVITEPPKAKAKGKPAVALGAAPAAAIPAATGGAEKPTGPAGTKTAPVPGGAPAAVDRAPGLTAAAPAFAGTLPPLIVEPKSPPKPLVKSELSKSEASGRKPSEAGPKSGFQMFGGRSAFTTPALDLLTGEVSAAAPIDREGLTATAEKLRNKLASFGINGQVTQIRPGPVVTMFEFLPAAGVKVSRIASLSDDLAMAMEAMRVRIVAPIPGKGVVGIEIPNKVRQSVVLRELVEQEAFQKSPSRLAMCLGKDIEGMPYIVDLAKMPHVLIAGTTGSGKSVAVNAMIVSMLLRATPEEVRFLMVDPKMLELSVYEGIPHLLLPVVTDSKKAAMALRWAVEEMERRYPLLADCGVRNIGSYNKKVEKEGDLARKPQKAPTAKRVVDLTDPNLDVHQLAAAAARGEVTGSREQIGLRPTAAGESAPRSAYLADGPGAQHGGEALNRGAAANGAGSTAATTAEWLREEMLARGERTDLPGDPGPQPEHLKKLPYLVIIIDELADLMMVASREVETYIARLAQMARAAGIHLMVATQRPSTDVVTGVIKANFPARISFQVASRHDSATIINANGAENLLGMGDMLILPPGTSTLTRVHGPYVDEKEIHAVVEHWRAQGAPVYDPNILKPRAEDGEGEGAAEDEGPDELYDQALAALADMRFISISLLQRKLRVGYNRAARMIERMERDGIVGAADGAKPREVLIRQLGEMPGAGA